MAEQPKHWSPYESEMPNIRVTNESVEASLRQMRNALRSSSEFRKDDAATHLKLARLFNHQGDPNGAIEEYQAAIQLNPLLAEAHRGLGAVYIDKHEWIQAEAALGQAVQLSPNDDQAYYWLGRALLAQFDHEGAKEAFSRSIQSAPQNPNAYSDLGLALMALGQIADAQTMLERAISLQPDFAEAHDRLERVHAGNNPQELILSAQDILDTLFRRE